MAFQITKLPNPDPVMGDNFKLVGYYQGIRHTYTIPFSGNGSLTVFEDQMSPWSGGFKSPLKFEPKYTLVNAIIDVSGKIYRTNELGLTEPDSWSPRLEGHASPEMIVAKINAWLTRYEDFLAYDHHPEEGVG